MVTATADLRDVLSEVVDPEIPVLTIADLGILRDVTETADGEVVVTITPTYSGCPAMEHLRSEITRVLNQSGHNRVRVLTTFQPAWTTDWMTAEAKAKLAEYGIAAPRGSSSDPILCPLCSADDNRLISEFGATACKALRVCGNCGEPFDHFKEI